MANKLRVGEFLGDVLIGQEYSSIYALVQRDTMSVVIESNEVAHGTYNSTRFGIFTEMLVSSPEYTGNGLYRVEFAQKVYDESIEVKSPELMAESRYLSTNISSANGLNVGSILRIIKLVSSIQTYSRSPVDSL